MTLEMHKNNGFTLLESLVALVVLSTAFAFVWEWFGTAITTSQKIEDVVELPLIFDQAYDKLELLTFENNDGGDFNLDGYVVTWKATVIRSSLTEAYRSNPAWEISLFKVELKFEKDGRRIASVNTNVVKHRRDNEYNVETLQ